MDVEGGEEKANKNLRIISANIHSLRPRAETVAAWQADVAALQETKLAPHAIAETSASLKGKLYRMTHGFPCQPQRYRKNIVTTHATNEANSGAVAVITRSHMATVSEKVQEQIPELYGLRSGQN